MSIQVIKRPVLNRGDSISVAAAGPIAVVAESSAIATGDGTAETTTSPTLDASGSSRVVVAVVTMDRGVTRTADSALLGGNSGTVLAQIAVDGGAACACAIIYWLDEDHPGSGAKDLVVTWNDVIGEAAHAIIEIENAAQTSTFSTENTVTDTATAVDAVSLGVSLSSETGELAIIGAAAGDANVGSSAVLACSNTDIEVADLRHSSLDLMQGTWVDNTIAASPTTWTVTGSGSSNTVDSWVAIAVAVRGA